MQKNSSIPSLTNNKVYPAEAANGVATGGGGGGGNYNQNIVNGIDSNKMVSCIRFSVLICMCFMCPMFVNVLEKKANSWRQARETLSK